MKLLFIDTETTGLFDFNLPAHADSQPRVAQFAATLCEEEQIICRLSAIIKPHNWTMTKEAEAIHGLSQEKLSHGINIGMVLAWYSIVLAEFMPLVVAHNVKFDTKAMRGEMRRAGIQDRFAETKVFCTMMESQKLMPGYQFPSLAEAVRFFFDEELVNAHSADADVEYCRRIYFEIQKRKLEAKANG